MPGVRLGDIDGGSRGDNIRMGRIERGLTLGNGHFRRLDLGGDLVAGGLGRAQFAPGLVEQAACLRPRCIQFLNAVKLGLPAGEVGVDPPLAGTDVDELRLGSRHVGLRHPDRCPGLLVLGNCLFDHGLLLLEFSVQLGDREFREKLALLDCRSDVDRPLR